MKTLVVGGAGYIGSHTTTQLIERGHEVRIVDNFCNASPAVLKHLQWVTGTQVNCSQADVRDRAAMESILHDFRPDAVIHFAALKAVGESWERPLDYFENNIGGTISLLQAMLTCGIKRIVFSSSATVYGVADHCPTLETAPLRVTSPYGRTKLWQAEFDLEQMCRDAWRWQSRYPDGYADLAEDEGNSK